MVLRYHFSLPRYQNPSYNFVDEHLWYLQMDRKKALFVYLFNTHCDSLFARIHQIENEYGNIKKDHKTEGDKYLEWAAQMALSTQTGVPWIMCKQSSDPGEVVTF